ncbi:PKD domain-containing protein [Candidatus Bipolaricaulota bacterium]|nr:PKD domain-containing protein [Candidatus Bipolaricaulota bacterium]
MKRMTLVVVLLGGVLGFATSCVFNPPLDACFSSLPDPNGGPLTVLFNAACSTYYGEPLGVGYIYEWHFGDGEVMQREHSSVLTTYTYREPGTYTVELLIIGWDGEMARATKMIDVDGS